MTLNEHDSSDQADNADRPPAQKGSSPDPLPPDGTRHGTAQPDATAPDAPPQPDPAPTANSPTDPTHTAVSTDPIDPSAATEEDDIPEYEPLSPELVEEEAIRGDIVLRWAVVLLALGAGSAQIAESATLVHVKTGQYLAAHGFWPWGNDPFSYTASDRPWANLSWAFDLLLSLAYAVGDFTGVAILKAVLSALIFYVLVRISRPGIPSWWGSICCALALLACHRQLTAEPQLITLLGLALTLRFLYDLGRSAGLSSPSVMPSVTSEPPLYDDGPGKPWPLLGMVPLFFVWGNLDPRAFLGLMLVLLFAVGESLGSKVGGSSLKSAGRRSLWIATGLAFVAGMLNPFGWRLWLEPLRLYGTTLPALRAYLGNLRGAELGHVSLADPVFWSHLDATRIASLVLLGIAAVSFALNWKRMELGQFFVGLGFVTLGVFHTHELAPAALVCAILANLNAQAWYAVTIRQEYSTAPAELVFSRGGRAITVVAFAAFALVLLTGRLGGETSRRTGYGLDADLKNSIASFSALLQDSLDHQPFNFTHNQGDVLIWIGEKVFLDSRLALYTGSGDRDLLTLHRTVRNALRRPQDDNPVDVRADMQPAKQLSSQSVMQAEARAARLAEMHRLQRLIWQQAFRRFHVTHVLPRLTGANPDYLTVFDLLQNPDFRLTALGAATAVFYHNDPELPEVGAYAAEHAFDFEREAFRKTSAAPGARNAWVAPPSFYDRYLWSNRREVPNEIQEALHCVRLATAAPIPGEKANDIRAALANLAVRRAQSGLAQAPNSYDGYVALGLAYAFLMQQDRGIVLHHMAGERYNLRYLQAVAAFNQCLVTNPDNSFSHANLYQLYLSMGRIDLALREARALQQELDQTARVDPQDTSDQRESLAKTIDHLEFAIARADQELQQIVKDQTGTEQFQVQFLARRGCVQKALELFTVHPDLLAGNPDISMLRAVLMFEAGKTEEAALEVASLQQASKESGSMNWAEPLAVIHLANGEFAQAVQALDDFANQLRLASWFSLSDKLPPYGTETSPEPWPVNMLSSGLEHLYSDSAEIASLRALSGLIRIECGELEGAAKDFEGTLDIEPDLPYRPLIAWYLSELTEVQVDPFPRREQVPALFAPEDGEADPDAVEDGEAD